jgi:hypothetical protein
MRAYTYKGWWTTQTLERHPRLIFIFGDNDVGRGIGGQAIIRGRENAMGLPTKRAPNNNESSFYNDKNFDEHVANMRSAISKILKRLEEREITEDNNNGERRWRGIVLPEDGFGTGLAQLDKRAPKTYAAMLEMVVELKRKVRAMS